MDGRFPNEHPRFVTAFAFLVSASILVSSIAFAQGNQKQKFPWMNKGLSPDERAEMVLKQMTIDEKIELLHDNGMAYVDQ